MAEFDEVIKERFGMIHGTGTLVFIKTGKGGSVYGYENKYLKIASKLHKIDKCAVIVSANPVDSECCLEEELREVTRYLGCFDDILFIGISNGALVGAQQAWKISKIKYMLLINGPLMINLWKTKEGIEKFSGRNVLMVYGQLDPSYRLYELLTLIKSPAFNYLSYEDVDHNFKGHEQDFEKIIIDYYMDCILTSDNIHTEQGEKS